MGSGRLTLQLEATDRNKDENVDLALRMFELSQRLREKWLTADFAGKSPIVEPDLF